MDYNSSSSYCYANFFSIPVLNKTGEVSVNFSIIQVLSLQNYCYQIAQSEVEDKYGKPMVLIGAYIAVASAICIYGLQWNKMTGINFMKGRIPVRLLTLNAVSITLMTVAMKLPMDLTSPMRGKYDQAAKLGSLLFMCTMIANLMPSLASIDNKELPANVIALAILVITIIVNVIMEINTGAIYPHVMAVLACISVALLFFLLIVLISFATSVPIYKHILEHKYQAICKTTLLDLHENDRFIVEQLRQHVTRYWVMAETGTPEVVMAGNVLSCASGIICGIGLAINLFLFQLLDFSRTKTPEFFQSQYKDSTLFIVIIQFFGVSLGSFVPILRFTRVVSYKSFARFTRKHFMIFKVEKYWTQKLYELKESHVPIPLAHRRLRSLSRKLIRAILSFCIGIENVTVVTCKMICLIPIVILILVKCCSNYIKSCMGMLSDTLPRSGDTNEDLSRYVLLLEDGMELAEEKLEIFLRSMNIVIKRSQKFQDKDLLKLLNKSTGFEGVSKFDIYQVVPPSLPLDLPNSWSLPVATLTCIAIALPNIGSDVTDNLFKSVCGGLRYTHLVDERLNNTCQYVNVQKAAMILWDEVEDTCKWLGKTLKKSAYEGKTAKEILEWFAHTAEEILNEVNSNYSGEPIEKLPSKLIIANSMKRIAQTIISTHNISEITKKQLFVLLSHMIADILVACFTNIPRVINMRCQESKIERRKYSVWTAGSLLGRTTEIIELIAMRELPSMDPDQLASIDEWRQHLQLIP